MKFENVCGQRLIINRLIENTAKNRIAHAQMFVGNSGLGSLAIPIAYAQYLNCTNRITYNTPYLGLIGDSCGTCPSCIKSQKLIHPDIHFAVPLNETKTHKKIITSDILPQWRNFILSYSPYASLQDWYDFLEIKKQGIISAEECNNIITTLNYKAYEGTYKIMIIWMIEKLYPTAAPKLLKIIEEPPDHTIFLLISANPLQVIETIRSRVQIIQLHQLKINETVEFLIKNFKTDKEYAVTLADQCQNNISEIIDILQGKDIKKTFMAMFIDWMRVCYRQNTSLIVDLVEKIKNLSVEQIKQFIEFSLIQIRNAWITKYHQQLRLGYYKEHTDFYEKFSNFINNENIIQLYDLLNKALADIERNANITILLTDLSFQISQVLRDKIINNKKAN